MRILLPLKRLIDRIAKGVHQSVGGQHCSALSLQLNNKCVVTRPVGRCHMRPSRIIAHYYAAYPRMHFELMRWISGACEEFSASNGRIS